MPSGFSKIVTVLAEAGEQDVEGGRLRYFIGVEGISTTLFFREVEGDRKAKETEARHGVVWGDKDGDRED